MVNPEHALSLIDANIDSDVDERLFLERTSDDRWFVIELLREEITTHSPCSLMLPFPLVRVEDRVSRRSDMLRFEIS